MMKALQFILYKSLKETLNNQEYLKRKFANKTILLWVLSLNVFFFYASYINLIDFNRTLFGFSALILCALTAALVYQKYFLLDLLVFLLTILIPCLFSFSNQFWHLTPSSQLFLCSIYSFVAPTRMALCVQLAASFILTKADYLQPHQLKDIAQSSFVAFEAVKSVNFLFVAILACFVEFLKAHLHKVHKKNANLLFNNEICLQKIQELNGLKDQLAETIEIKELFIQNFSHEMNNAMNGLFGALYAAKEKNQNPQVAQNISIAEACSELLRTFVCNVLDSEKMEPEQINLCLQTNSSATFFKQVWDIVKELIRNKRLNGFMKVSKRLPQIMQFDHQRLLQIFVNLTINALKYTQKGQIYFVVEWTDHASSKRSQSAKFQSQEGLSSEQVSYPLISTPSSNFIEEKIQETSNSTIIDVRTTKMPNFVHDYYYLDFQKNEWGHKETFEKKLNKVTTGALKFYLIDTGMGMDPEEIGKLLEGYSTLSKREKQKKIESNIGLWITRQIVNKMAGSVKFKAIPNVGSLFEVQVPIMVPAEQGVPLPTASQRKATGRPIQKTLTQVIQENSQTVALMGKKMKILLVDDDFFNIEFMSNLIAKAGRECIVAHDGEEAFQAFKNYQSEISLVLTDNQMPNMNGTELAELIKREAEKSAQRCPAIYLITGDTKGLPPIEIQRKMRILEVITKPVNFDKLSAIIGKH
mgnify:CR=1 FL=1